MQYGGAKLSQGGPSLTTGLFVKEPRGRPRGLGDALELRDFPVCGGRAGAMVDFVASAASESGFVGSGSILPTLGDEARSLPNLAGDLLAL